MMVEISRTNGRARANFIALGVGAVAAAVGLLPWLTSGMRLPAQNLWASQDLPGDMPFALLPFSQYYFLVLFGMIVLPGGIIGVVMRRYRRDEPEARRFTPLLAAVALMAIQITALIQAARVTAAGLRHIPAAQTYTGAIDAAIVACIVIGVAIALVIALGTPGLATVAAAGAAVALGYWIAAFPLTDFTTFLKVQRLARAFSTTGEWAPGVATGIALAWYGWRPGKRFIGTWAGTLAVLWVGKAIVDGLFGMVSNRVDLGSFNRMAENGFQVFKLSLKSGLIALAVAAAIGAAGCIYGLYRAATPGTLALKPDARPTTDAKG